MSAKINMNLREFFPKDKLIWEVTKGLLYGVFPAIFFLVLPNLKSRIDLYDITFITISGIIFVVFLVYDIFIQSNDRYKDIKITLTIYTLSIISFFAITNWSSEELIRGNLPIVFTFIILITSKVTYFSKIYIDNIDLKKKRKNIGFAATGILINIGNIEKPSIIIVLNKNLRGGEGLWVPPGGHYFPYTERAEDRIKTKINQEIGVDCEIFNPYPLNVPHRIEDADTDEVKWLLPPVFFLEENLIGKCSEGHDTHIDLIYLCITHGKIVNKRHKYNFNNRVEIPLMLCVNNYEETEKVVCGIIDDYHMKISGSKPSTRKDIPKDVIWRIYLSAKIFHKYYNNKEQ
jgi:hypothetical protein